MQTVNLKEHKEVAAVINAAFPGYRKQKAFLKEFYPTQINSYWQDGSKDYFAIVDLRSMRSVPMPTSTHPFYEIENKGLADKDNGVIETDHVGNLTLKALPENFALVRGGIFYGKPATACVMVNSSNLTKLLTAGGSQ